MTGKLDRGTAGCYALAILEATVSQELDGDECASHALGAIFCANCLHCKLVTEREADGSQYRLRVRCNAGKWRRKGGEEKFYKYSTVIRRRLEDCDAYEPMGDLQEFLRELKRTLPVKDESYLIGQY
ncbi:MAG: hypothetical protein ACOCYC_02070 [bacterium]